MSCTCTDKMDVNCPFHKSFANDPRLTPEQQKIVAGWEAEQAERFKIYDKLEAAEKNNDWQLMKNLVDELAKTSPSHCEHGRSIWSRCGGCDEIERIIHPELFEDEDDDGALE